MSSKMERQRLFRRLAPLLVLSLLLLLCNRVCAACTANCAVADCSGHAQCVNGVCLCRAGWKGNDCSDGQFRVCLQELI